MMGLRWTEESYTRLYRRDTADWLLLSVEAQGLYALLRRKSDRAGLIDLGRSGARAVAAVIGHPTRWPDIEGWLGELLAGGWVEDCGTALLIAEYLESEESQATPAQRQRVHRERARDQAKARSVLGPGSSERPPVSHSPVTLGVTLPVTQAVTQDVTLPVTQAVTQDVTLTVTQPGHAGGHGAASLLPSVPTDPSVPSSRARAQELEEPEHEPPTFADPVAATRDTLEAMAPPICWLVDLHAEERLSAGCVGGQTIIADIVAAVTASATMLGPELGAVKRDDKAGLARVEAFVARKVADEQRRRRSRGGAALPRTPAVRTVAPVGVTEWALARWAALHKASSWGYGAYLPGDADEQLVERALAKATSIAEHEHAPDIAARARAVFETAAAAWFADEYFARSGHSLAWFAQNLEREPARFLSARQASHVPAIDDDDEPPATSKSPLHLPIDSAPPEFRDVLRKTMAGQPGPREGACRRPTFDDFEQLATGGRR